MLKFIYRGQMAPVKGSCKKGVFGRCFGAVSTATFFFLGNKEEKKGLHETKDGKKGKVFFFL